MKQKIVLTGLLSIALISCGGKGKASDKKDDKKDTTKTEQTTEKKSNGKIEDFPKDPITGAKGDYVLLASKDSLGYCINNGKPETTYFFNSQKLAEAGSGYSKIDSMGYNVVEIPNYLIIPIKFGQTTKKGDIVLTWLQSGRGRRNGGMMRAIVVDDKNPAEPIVNYIDISWDSFAKNDKGVSLGQMTEQLKPNSFHIITSSWEAGATVAIKEDGRYKKGTIVKVSGEKVLTIDWKGMMQIYDKADCIPINIIPTVKKGDAVQTPLPAFIFGNTTVEKVDAKMGRVWCTDPYGGTMVVPFGDVTTGLDIKK